jgi:CIC family chloride channel protein
MSSNPEAAQYGESGKYGLAKIALLSLLTGAAIGLVIGCFRVALEHMNTARTDTITWTHQWPVLGFVLVCAPVAATTAFAAWLVQRSGQPAAGSGIPHVEAVIEGKLPAAPVLLFPIKFIGGLFAPILALGACLGLGVGLLCPQFVGDSGAIPANFAIAGMAAFLTATVRAPVTGMILIFEMTGAFNQALPMLWACFAAMAIPTLMGNMPIYDSMKARTIGVAKKM